LTLEITETDVFDAALRSAAQVESLLQGDPFTVVVIDKPDALNRETAAWTCATVLV
jgi:hypothetical protein